jgi:FtsP/CotA-like multicopper oxidase with cupredoxin domain
MAGEKLTRPWALHVLGAPVVAGATGVGLAAGRDPADRVHVHPNAAPVAAHDGHAGSAHAGFAGSGVVDPAVNGFDPSELVREFDWGKTRRLASGRVLREWELIAHDKEIEVAPGVKFAAWTYNGRVPGPTLRAHEGELLRIRFVNGSAHPHTIHFHGIHPSFMDGVPGIGAGLIQTGGGTTDELGADAFGVHL